MSTITKVTSERPVSERAAKNKEVRAARRAKINWPRTVGGCVDLLYELQQQRRDIAKKEGDIKEREVALREHMRAAFKAAKLHGAQGAMARVEIVPTEVPNVEDWVALYKYITKNGAWDIIQKRVSSTAIRERWDAKKSVPGVKKVSISEMSLHKLPPRKQRK